VKRKAYLRVVIGVLAQVEAGVVNNVTLLHDIRTLRHVSPSRILTDGLEADIVVWVGCSGKAFKHTLLSKEQGADVDGKDSALFAGTLLLKLDILGKEAERLRLVLENLKDTLTTRDNEDVEVLKLVVGVLR
jgi:hypothetical protein